MPNRPAALALSFALLSAAGTAASAPAAPSKMLTEPALSAERIAFVYGNDVWTCRLDGGGVQRITSGPGAKTRPAFSPDGSLLAFSAELDGNLDVYVVPAAGGVPKRLTWHPGRDVVQGFTHDGTSVLFTSPRAAVNNRHTQLYTVPVDGGLETQLPIPYASRAAYSPDGRTIAYNPNNPAHLQWKRYRGGLVSKVWLVDMATNALDRVPQPATRCNDVDPMWLSGTLYLRSDRDGEFNLYSYDAKSKALARLTDHKDFPVLNAAAAAGRIVYEQAGTLHLLDAASKKTTDLAITVAGDLLETRPRWAKGAKWIRGAALSPSGARAAFEFRGEIVTVPADKGDFRNLTNTTAAHERAPAWSPDGREIAYLSDESGEYELVVRAQDGKGAVKKIRVTGSTGFYDDLVFSPDGKKICLTDNSLTLFVVDVATGGTWKVASERLYAPARQRMLRGSWSPDSKWLAYTLSGPTYIRTAYVYSLDDTKSYALTDGLSDVSDPVFDRAGKLIYFLASTDAGPQRNWFSLQNTDARTTNAIYVATLKKGTPSPLAKENDEEKGETKDGRDAKGEDRKEEDSAKGTAGDQSAGSKSGDAKASAGAAKPPKKPEPVVIDRDGFNLRIVDLPVHPAEIQNLQAGAAGQIFFEKRADGKTSIQRFDFKDRKAETVVPEADDYFVSFDGRKLLFRHRDATQREAPPKDSWSIVASSGKKPDPKEGGGDGKLKLDAIQVRVDPRAEWPEIFDEAWRVNRDYFYDPKMHGQDWNALKVKYLGFLPYLSSRGDLNRLIQWMCSELAVGHHRNTPGDAFAEATPVPGGLLGADYEVANGRYRFRKVFGGLNWNPELRAPLSEPGVEVKAGEYLLAVNGRNLAPPESVYARFEATAGRIVEITVGPAADGKGSRTVNVVPIADEAPLRNRDWVESNLRKVDAATGGRVAYVYVPNTAGLGHAYFKRYFYPQAAKDAIIVDERFNGGGSVADYYIEALTRQPIAWWAMRYGDDLKTPSASIQGPKVMLIDETAGSGGDLLPWMFRHFKVGTLVGQRTWGGLVGILGFPTLMDGAVVTSPNLGFWTPEEGFGVENVGVPPDVEVEQTPADVIAGHDPQLEKAIEIVMAELKKNPPVKPQRPPMPVR